MVGHKTILFLVLILIATVKTSFGQAFTFEHSDCNIRIKKYSGELDELRKKSEELLKERDYIVKKMIDNKRLLAGELYFTLSLERPREKIYTSCVIDVAIKQAKGAIPSERDQTIYQKSINRRLPRITLDGEERCRMAIKDAFVHIPVCKKIGFAGEKK